MLRPCTFRGGSVKDCNCPADASLAAGSGFLICLTGDVKDDDSSAIRATRVNASFDGPTVALRCREVVSEIVRKPSSCFEGVRRRLADPATLSGIGGTGGTGEGLVRDMGGCLTGLGIPLKLRILELFDKPAYAGVVFSVSMASNLLFLLDLWISTGDIVLAPKPARLGDK